MRNGLIFTARSSPSKYGKIPEPQPHPTPKPETRPLLFAPSLALGFPPSPPYSPSTCLWALTKQAHHASPAGVSDAPPPSVALPDDVCLVPAALGVVASWRARIKNLWGHTWRRAVGQERMFGCKRHRSSMQMSYVMSIHELYLESFIYHTHKQTQTQTQQPLPTF